jgi:hypothetical protein
MENVVIFRAIWYIIWSFGIFCRHSGIFSTVLVYYTKKNLATLVRLNNQTTITEGGS